MPHDELIEPVELRFADELSRIGDQLQRGDLEDRTLLDLSKLLHDYNCVLSRSPKQRQDFITRFPEGSDELTAPSSISELIGLLQDTQSQLRSRMSALVERLEAHDATRQAYVSYGSVAQREYESPMPHAFRYPT